MKYYVEYSQDCGFGAANTACVIIEGRNLYDVYVQLKNRTFSTKYYISYYTEISDTFLSFLYNVLRRIETVDCVFEVPKSMQHLNEDDIIDYYRDKDCKGFRPFLKIKKVK